MLFLEIFGSTTLRVHPSNPTNIQEQDMTSSHLQRLGTIRGYLLFGALLIMATSLFAASGIYSFTLNSIDGKPAPLADYKGKVVLVVNVASQCGYTPQYSALEVVYEK